MIIVYFVLGFLLLSIIGYLFLSTVEKIIFIIILFLVLTYLIPWYLKGTRAFIRKTKNKKQRSKYETNKKKRTWALGKLNR